MNWNLGGTVSPVKVVIVGQGYVGLPLAMRAVQVGHRVVGYDTDSQRVKKLTMGESYVEDISSEVLCKALDSARYSPTDLDADCADFDVAIVTVPTPLSEGFPDLSYVDAAAHTLGAHVRPGVCIVLESTTYPGTTEERFAPALASMSGLTPGIDFHVGYSPERIDPGNRRWGLTNTPKIVSGVTPESLMAVRAFYNTLVECTVAVSRPREAELTKLIENTFRHVNIALVNELAISADALGLDFWEALNAASTKPFGFTRFEPGPGVGGHCLPVDPSYLAWHVKRRVGSPFRFVELANDINDNMPSYVVRRLARSFNRRSASINGQRILLLGLAYKPDTSDARESPAIEIAKQLSSLGAKLRVVDPYVDCDVLSGKALRVELTEEEISAADAVVLLTSHSAFDYDLIERHASFIFDTRHRVSGPQVEYL